MYRCKRRRHADFRIYDNLKVLAILHLSDRDHKANLPPEPVLGVVMVLQRDVAVAVTTFGKAKKLRISEVPCPSFFPSFAIVNVCGVQQRTWKHVSASSAFVAQGRWIAAPKSASSENAPRLLVTLSSQQSIQESDLVVLHAVFGQGVKRFLINFIISLFVIASWGDSCGNKADLRGGCF